MLSFDKGKLNLKEASASPSSHNYCGSGALQAPAKLSNSLSFASLIRYPQTQNPDVFPTQRNQITHRALVIAQIIFLKFCINSKF